MRRPAYRLNRGRIAVPMAVSGAGPLDPLTIIGGTPYFFYSGDLGVTIGTGVSNWADQSGNSRDASQGTGGAQPGYNASELNGRGVLTFDGTDDFMQLTTWDPPAPGTTPVMFWGVIQTVSWVGTDCLFGGGGISMLRCRQCTSSPRIACNNGVVGPDNAGAVVGSYVQFMNLFNNSTTDYLYAGGVSATGTNTGNNDVAAGAFRLCSDDGVSRFGNFKFACFGAWQADFSAGVKSSLASWIAAYYGGSVVL